MCILHPFFLLLPICDAKHEHDFIYECHNSFLSAVLLASIFFRCYEIALLPATLPIWSLVTRVNFHDALSYILCFSSCGTKPPFAGFVGSTIVDVLPDKLNTDEFYPTFCGVRLSSCRGGDWLNEAAFAAVRWSRKLACLAARVWHTEFGLR